MFVSCGKQVDKSKEEFPGMVGFTRPLGCSCILVGVVFGD